LLLQQLPWETNDVTPGEHEYMNNSKSTVLSFCYLPSTLKRRRDFQSTQLYFVLPKSTPSSKTPATTRHTKTADRPSLCQYMDGPERRSTTLAHYQSTTKSFCVVVSSNDWQIGSVREELKQNSKTSERQFVPACQLTVHHPELLCHD